MIKIITICILVFIVSFTNLLGQSSTLYSWGVNEYGQLGSGDTVAYNVEQLQVQNDADWQSVSAGHIHNLAVKTDGTLWAWGNNASGQLGIGPINESLVPAQVGKSSGWVTVKSGTLYSLALKSDGSLWAWGGNSSGQLGLGSQNNTNIPVKVGVDTDWASISAGSYTSLAVKKDGTLWAWGANWYGQLGDGTIVEKAAPIQIGSNSDWSVAFTAWAHSMAIKKDGTLWAWGINNRGQLGDGTTEDKHTPVKIGEDNDWLSVSLDHYTSFAIKTDGTLWGWGMNHWNQLGDGTQEERHFPMQIGEDTNWVSISTGESSIVAVKTDGTLWGWGRNTEGQLGNGTTENVDMPVQIGEASNWSIVNLGTLHSLGLKLDKARKMPTLIPPTSNEINENEIVVGFSLPEVAKEESVKLTFTNSGGKADPNAPHVITFKNSFTASGSYNITLDGNILSMQEGVGTVNSAPNDLLVKGAEYTTTISYIGINESNAATVSYMGFLYEGAEVITSLEAKPDQQQKVIVYPNPTSGTVSLRSDNIIGDKLMEASLFSYDGKKVWQKKGRMKDINTSLESFFNKINKGMYLLKFVYDNENTTVKILKN